MPGNETTKEIRRMLVEASSADTERSEELYMRCVELDDGTDNAAMGDAEMPPFRLRPYLLLASIWRKRGEHQRAANILERALQRWPDHAFTLAILG
ncbi:MAG TPA: tetratricopeptide repeat protein, partial [Kofleriaceae bacterium]